jgi:hypothetical protein
MIGSLGKLDKIMSDINESANKQIGLIPDFFHDIIAFLIPGWAFIVLIAINALILKIITINDLSSFDLNIYLSVTVFSYVLGRLFEQIGLLSIHYYSPGFLKNTFKFGSNPKWSLLFDDKEKKYTDSFKENAVIKITEWLEKQDGEMLVKECKEQEKDDYFNIIQFYLRERFPAVALYEKKQNATIILSRSLSIIFLSNALIYGLMSIIKYPISSLSISFSSVAFWWVLAQIFCALIFYTRFIVSGDLTPPTNVHGLLE